VGSTPRTIAILGSTGSIGTQALDVIRRNPDRFGVVALAAGGRRVDEIVAQARGTGAAVVGVADERAAEAVAGALPGVRVEAGPGAAAVVAASGADVVLNGMTGSVGLRPTLAALEAGSTLALANKESLVAGGALVRAAARRPDQIVPVDSEHSALAQALRAGAPTEGRRLILTASGGPFRGRARAELVGVTPEEALRHPTWDMGPVVTVNSATLVNKALEVIEAHVLFDVPVDRIDVVVHPQSVVHSMVEFVDGSTVAQASPPDMRLPIALALGWPDRVPDAAPACDWTGAREWTFEPLDDAAFPAVAIARRVRAAPRRLQRRERGGRRRVPRRSPRLPRDRRHRLRRRRRLFAVVGERGRLARRRARRGGVGASGRAVSDRGTVSAFARRARPGTSRRRRT
jgi:1-deoxy-D-xylulose-5-phosphate reductoisomerase